VASRYCRSAVQFSLGEIISQMVSPHLAPSTPLALFHFCSARDSRWMDPFVFAESLAMQLASRYPEFARALAEKSSDRQIRIEV